ncbi:histidine-rich glycoprotein [Drosophila ficusphila]|uniref:histidine-rich glycoprotein n=1 Tax=Drosophila ficusphila TaxID=30025 RepID=UPI0007E77C2C|nr:histidine-rich glycoprotein [Drosophila ficusphila]
MALRFVVVFSVFIVLVQGSLHHGDLNEAHQSDIVGAEGEVPQEEYLPAEDAVEPHSHHHEHSEAEIGGDHHGHDYQAQSHHHEHGPHHHVKSHHHLSESHHHHQESHHLVHEGPHHHHHHEAHHHIHGGHHHDHHHLHGIHGHHGHHGVHHLHHHRNCHATIHCPRVHSPTYATDGHVCFHVENPCELAVLNCLRRNELKPLLRHIGHHECHHLPTAHRSH